MLFDIPQCDIKAHYNIGSLRAAFDNISKEDIKCEVAIESSKGESGLDRTLIVKLVNIHEHIYVDKKIKRLEHIEGIDD